MIFTTANFLIFIVCGLISFWNLPASWRGKLVLPALNVAFFVTFISPSETAFLALFLVCGYCLTLLANKFKSALIFWGSIGLLLLLFLYLRQYTLLSFLPYPENFPFVVGLSYVFFRVMQLVIDCASNDIEKTPGILDYFNFTCNFLMLLSGPIQRFQDYIEQQNNLEKSSVNEEEALYAFLRILNGYVKVGPLSAFLLFIHNHFLTQMNAIEFNDVLSDSLIMGSTASFYTIFLYMNFSGYTDIVIGLARLFGLKPPENFNKPFTAENFIDLWQRWHMSLANWMKIYVFNPTLKLLAYKIKSPAFSIYLSAIAFFVTFLLLGAWHGPTLPFLLCGAMLGFGMALNKLYQVGMKNKIGKKALKNLQSFWPYRQICFGLTFMWLSFSIVGFWAGWETIVSYTVQGGIIFILTTFSLTIILSACARVLFDAGAAPIRVAITAINASSKASAVKFVYLSTLILGLYFYFQYWQIEPLEFIYEGF